MSQYKELANTLKNLTHNDMGFYAAVDEAIAILSSLDAQPVAWGVFANVKGNWHLQFPVHSTEKYAREDLQYYKKGSLLDIRPLYAAPIAAQPTEDLTRFGYAPGNYMVKCVHCKNVEQWVDKRATTCLPCARAMQAAQPQLAIKEWMKPHPKCDESCLYACTEGFTKFPDCTHQAKPEPLTGAELDRIIQKVAGGAEWSDEEYETALHFARAVEAAHGIKEQG